MSTGLWLVFIGLFIVLRWRAQGREYFRAHGRHQGMQSEGSSQAAWLVLGILSVLCGAVIIGASLVWGGW